MTTTSPPPSLSSSSSYSTSSASSLDNAHCTPLQSLWGLPADRTYSSSRDSNKDWLAKESSAFLQGHMTASKHFPAKNNSNNGNSPSTIISNTHNSGVLTPLNTTMAAANTSSPTSPTLGGSVSSGGSITPGSSIGRPHTPSASSTSSTGTTAGGSGGNGNGNGSANGNANGNSGLRTPTTSSSLFASSARDGASIWSSSYVSLHQQRKATQAPPSRAHTTPGTPLEEMFSGPPAGQIAALGGNGNVANAANGVPAGAQQGLGMFGAQIPGPGPTGSGTPSGNGGARPYSTSAMSGSSFSPSKLQSPLLADDNFAQFEHGGPMFGVQYRRETPIVYEGYGADPMSLARAVQQLHVSQQAGSHAPAAFVQHQQLPQQLSHQGPHQGPQVAQGPQGPQISQVPQLSQQHQLQHPHPQHSQQSVHHSQPVVHQAQYEGIVGGVGVGHSLYSGVQTGSLPPSSTPTPAPSLGAGPAPVASPALIGPKSSPGSVGSVSSGTGSTGGAVSSAKGSSSSKKKPTTNTDLYKTELCASFMNTGGHCPYGEKCQFAHGEKELKFIDRPPKWRSKPCQNWIKNGTCSYNARCCFRHDL